MGLSSSSSWYSYMISLSSCAYQLGFLLRPDSLTDFITTKQLQVLSGKDQIADFSFLISIHPALPYVGLGLAASACIRGFKVSSSLPSQCLEHSVYSLCLLWDHHFFLCSFSPLRGIFRWIRNIGWKRQDLSNHYCDMIP